MVNTAEPLAEPAPELASESTPEQTPAPTPEQAPQPAHPLRNAYDYLQKESDVQVPDTYEEFQAKILEKPERLRVLRDFFDEQNIETGSDYNDFQTKMLKGLSGPPAESAKREAPVLKDSAGLIDTASAHPGIQAAPDEPFLEAGVTPPSGEELRALTEKEALAKLAALPGSVNSDVREVVDRQAIGEQPAPLEFGMERVVIPKNHDAQVPENTVTDANTGLRYFDRPLNDEVDGKSQTAAEGAWALFKNSLTEMGQGAVEGIAAVANATTNQPYDDAGDVVSANMEAGKSKVSDLNAKQPFSLAHPSTALLKSAEYAPLVVAQVAQTLAPELRAPAAVSKVLGLVTTAAFDAQMYHGAAEHAKAAGLTGKEASLYTLVEGTLVVAGFKTGSKLMGALGDKLAQKIIPRELREQVARDVVASVQQLKAKLGRTATNGEVRELLHQSLRKALPGLAQVPKEMAQQAGIFADAEAIRMGVNQTLAPALGGQAEELTPAGAAENLLTHAGAGATMGAVTGLTGTALGAVAKPAATEQGASPEPPLPAKPELKPAAVLSAPDAAPVDATGRIEVAPIIGEAPKKRQDILLDLRRLSGLNLGFGKRPNGLGRGSFGSYDAESGAVRVTAAGDLNVTARAIGHALDVQYQLGSLPLTPAATAEQADLAQHGSTAPKYHPDPTAYYGAEAWSEYIRARIVNPEAAQQRYPEYSAFYDTQVPPKVQANLDAFGKDVRMLEGASAHETIMSSVRMKPAEKGSIMAVLKPAATGPGFQLTFGDRLKTALLTSFHPFEKAMKFAQQAQGLDPSLTKPEDNPALLARLYLGVHDKMDNIIEKGLVDAKNQRRVDADTQQPMTLKWLYEGLDTSSEAGIAHEQEQVISSLIARRTVEMVNRRVADDIKEALDQGNTVAPEVLAANPELQRRFGKQNAENLDKKAGRHLGTLQAQGQAEQEVRDNIARQKQRWSDLSTQAEQALVGSQPARDKLRSVEEGMGRLEAAQVADEFAASGKRVSGRVRTILREAQQRMATLRGNARERAAIQATKRVQEVMAERLKGLNRLEQARLKAVREKYASSYQPRAAQHTLIDGHQKDVVTGIGAGLVSDLKLARQRMSDHDALATSNPAQHARIEEATRRYQAYADANLQYMVEKGRLSQEQYEAIKANNAQYVALQRVMEAEPGAEIQVFTGRSLRDFTKSANVVKSLSGSGRIIKDPYGSLLEATYRTVKEADRNTIMVAMRDLLTGANGTAKPSVTSQSLAEIGRRAEPGDPHTVAVFVNGVRENWQLAPELFKAIEELGNTPLDGPLAKLLQSPAKLLRWSVTHSPVFAVRNVIRDQRSRAVVSTNGLGGGLKVLTSKAAYREATDGLELHGGGQAGHYLVNEQAYYDTMQRTVAELAQDKRFILADPAKLAKGAWRRYTSLLGGSETISRKMEYRAAYQKAKVLKMDDYNASLYAAHEARDLMDFAVAGSAIRELNKYVPFTNAAVQGLRKAARTAQSDPGRFALRWAVTALAPALALRAYVHKMGKDDEYAQLPAYQRDGFDNIPLPGGQWLVIPRPFELGTMAASADRFLSKEVYGDEHAWEGYGSSLAKSFIPVDDAAVAGPLRPLVEVLTNHDIYHDKAIVPAYEEPLGLPLRHTERGSRLGQWVGNAVGVDSRKVDHLVKGMGSYYGDWLLKASNMGRTDGMGQSFGVPDTGFIRETASTHARDVEYMQRRLKEANLGQSHWMKDVKEKADAYYNAPDPDTREQAAEQLRRFAVQLRAALDEEFFREHLDGKQQKGAVTNLPGLPATGDPEMSSEEQPQL